VLSAHANEAQIMQRLDIHDLPPDSSVRERIQHSLLNFPQGFEQQTVLNLLADQDALELVCEPFSDLESNLAVYQALRKLFLS
jgi:hypothetical protein